VREFREETVDLASVSHSWCFLEEEEEEEKKKEQNSLRAFCPV